MGCAKVKGRAAQGENDVNLPNLIARSKQKDKGQTEWTQKAKAGAKVKLLANVNHTMLTRAHIEVSIHLSKQWKNPFVNFPSHDTRLTTYIGLYYK